MRFQLPSLTPFVMAAMMAAPSLAASPGLYLCQNWGFNDRPDNFCYKYTEPWGKCSKIPFRPKYLLHVTHLYTQPPSPVVSRGVIEVCRPLGLTRGTGVPCMSE